MIFRIVRALFHSTLVGFVREMVNDLSRQPVPLCRPCWEIRQRPAALFYTDGRNSKCVRCMKDTAEQDLIWVEGLQ